MMSAKINIQPFIRYGQLKKAKGMLIESDGPSDVFLGELCYILDKDSIVGQAEVVGFHAGTVYLMPYETLSLKESFTIAAQNTPLTIPANDSLLGRVIDAFGNPLDEGSPLKMNHKLTLILSPINPLKRHPIQEPYLTGVPMIDTLLPMGKGQRMGLFGGSGVGKSTLLTTLIKQSESSVNIIALIGERGREAQEWYERLKQTEQLSRSILIIATSDTPPVTRRLAAFTAHVLARYFSQTHHTTLFLDSMTRLAMAEREISLSLGAPPTSKGYTPDVFAALPKWIEQAGNYHEQGSFTAIYTVLMEADDIHDPIVDHLRALLDGHIVLSRELAQKGYYPAIDMIQSCSRLATQLTTAHQQSIIQDAMNVLTTYENHKDAIELGMVTKGANETLDKALERYPKLIEWLYKPKNLNTLDAVHALERILK